MRRLAPSRVCLALAVVAAASGGAFAGGAGGLALPPAPPAFGDLQLPALIEALDAPRAERLPGAAVDLDTFRPFGREDAALSEPTPGGPHGDLPTLDEQAIQTSPSRSDPTDPPSASTSPSDLSSPGVAAKAPDSAPPDPVPNALAAALGQFVIRDDRTNPVGAGDWPAAKAAIGAFYAARGFEPVWVDADGLTPAGRSAAAQIARASEDGLKLDAAALPRNLAGPLDPQARAAAEIAVAASVVAYAEQASGSRLAPDRLSPILAVRPEVADPGEALTATAAAIDPGARLADFNPPQKGYRALRDALRRLDEKASAEPPDPRALGLDGPVTDAPAFNDAALVGAAAKTAKTPAGRRAYVASLAASGARRSQARERAEILANMEMWRLEPRDMGERRIEVNIPDYSVSLTDGDEVLLTSRVVVGKPNTPTPVFSDRMRYVVINPSWNVPDSIIKKEILPRLDHFVARGYEVKTVGGRTVVRQPPGDDNALGRLAFMFPNDHSIYLHDTPSRRLFSEETRAFSHGCVRVQEPRRLAELLLNWPAPRLDKAIGGRERTVFLPEPLPIHIEYFTAFVGEDGALEQRPDVYGLTQRIADILSLSRQD